MYHNIFYRYKQ